MAGEGKLLGGRGGVLPRRVEEERPRAGGLPEAMAEEVVVATTAAVVAEVEAAAGEKTNSFAFGLKTKALALGLRWLPDLLRSGGESAFSSAWVSVSSFTSSAGEATSLAATDDGEEATALWSGTNKNRDVSTRPLAHPFARSLAPLTRSLAPDCSLRLRPPLHSLVCSLAHFAHSLARGKV